MAVNMSMEMPTVRYLRPLRSSTLVTGFLNHPSGCVAIGPYGNDTTFRADRCIQFGEKLLAAAPPVPGKQHVGVHGVARTRAPQRQRVLLAVVVDQHAVAAVERAFRHGIDQPERGHHGAGGKHVDLEVAAGHVVDRLGVVECVFVEDILRRPSALKAHADGALGIDNGRGGDRRGGARCGHFQKAAAAGDAVLV